MNFEIPTVSKEIDIKSVELKSAFSECADVFNSHLESINGIANDIKNAEKYLKSKHICIPFRKTFYECSISQECNEYGLAWDIIDGSAEFRLLAEQWQSDADGIHYERTFFRPFIECPINIRLALFPFFPLFVTSFAEKLMEDQVKAKLMKKAQDELKFDTSDEIPF